MNTISANIFGKSKKALVNDVIDIVKSITKKEWYSDGKYGLIISFTVAGKLRVVYVYSADDTQYTSYFVESFRKEDITKSIRFQQYSVTTLSYDTMMNYTNVIGINNPSRKDYKKIKLVVSEEICNILDKENMLE